MADWRMARRDTAALMELAADVMRPQTDAAKRMQKVWTRVVNAKAAHARRGAGYSLHIIVVKCHACQPHAHIKLARPESDCSASLTSTSRG